MCNYLISLRLVYSVANAQSSCMTIDLTSHSCYPALLHVDGEQAQASSQRPNPGSRVAGSSRRLLLFCLHPRLCFHPRTIVSGDGQALLRLLRRVLDTRLYVW